MSQIANFTYLNSKDVPLLGFWSKPKNRLFRKPIIRLQNYLDSHKLRDVAFLDADGVYVALAIRWLNEKNIADFSCNDPVIDTLRKNTGESHWIITFNHSFDKFVNNPNLITNNNFSDNDMIADFRFSNFELALKFIKSRILELQHSEALLISIG